MRVEKLAIDYDDDDGWVTLRSRDRRGAARESSFQLRQQFHLEDLHLALLATGWVEHYDDGYALQERVSVETLCRVVGEMFTYFDAPNLPGQPLRRIKQAVDQYGQQHNPAVEISLWACAWLDLVVREDLADDARSVDDAWSGRPITVDARRHCQRRLDELLQRHAPSTAAENEPSDPPRMAASARLRDSRGDAKTG